MSAPAFKAAGTGSETSLAWPTHVAGDRALVFVETTSESVTTPTDCTVIPGAPIQNDASPNTRLHAYQRKAAGASEPALSIPGGAVNHAWGALILYENVHQLYPFAALATAYHFNAMTVGYFPSVKTLVDDCKIVNACSYNADNAGDLSSSEANADLTNVTERYAAGTATGGGGGIIVIDGDKAAAGDVTRTTCTLTSTAICSMTIALAPIADQEFSGAVTIDGDPAPESDGSNYPRVYLYDITQPAASYLVLDAATETQNYSLIDEGGNYTFLVPYDDHTYIAVYYDDAETEPAVAAVLGACVPAVAGTGRDITIVTESSPGGSGYPRSAVVNA